MILIQNYHISNIHVYQIGQNFLPQKITLTHYVQLKKKSNIVVKYSILKILFDFSITCYFFLIEFEIYF